MSVQETMTREELIDENTRLKSEALKSAAHRPVSCKVSAKGAISVYGLGRFPITQYQSQWETLAANMTYILGFARANSTKLRTKGQPWPTDAPQPTDA